MTTEVDIAVVGAGPAGCSAVLMADSLGLTTTLIDPEPICAKVSRIPVLANVLGFDSGAAFAARAAYDVGRTTRCLLRIGERVESFSVKKDRVEVVLSSGEFAASAVLFATGVSLAPLELAEWATFTPGVTAPQLVDTPWTQLDGRSLLVIGADRPLGTLLRAQPDLDILITVAYSARDAYKTEELNGDPRVRLQLVRNRLAVTDTGAQKLQATIDDSIPQRFDLAVTNLGVLPVVPQGPLIRNELGYCPPRSQGPRVLIAGDLRSVRGQRIAVAIGSGAEAVLDHYYALTVE